MILDVLARVTADIVLIDSVDAEFPFRAITAHTAGSDRQFLISSGPLSDIVSIRYNGSTYDVDSLTSIDSVACLIEADTEV